MPDTSGLPPQTAAIPGILAPSPIVEISSPFKRQSEERAQREREANRVIARFQRGVTGAGISLSQAAAGDEPDNAGAEPTSLSERRDVRPDFWLPGGHI